jgi:hypothetical protein
MVPKQNIRRKSSLKTRMMTVKIYTDECMQGQDAAYQVKIRTEKPYNPDRIKATCRATTRTVSLEIEEITVTIVC